MRFIKFLIVAIFISSIVAQDQLCTTCKHSITSIRDSLANPNSDLISKFSAYCDRVPTQYQGFCKIGMTLYGSRILSFIRTKMELVDADAFCNKWKLCGSNLEFSQGYLCQACMVGVSLIRDYMNQPDEVLIQMLVASCDSLPEPYVTGCKLAFISYGRTLIQLVRDNLTEQPRALCLRLGACSDEKQRLFLTFFKKTGPMCDPCKVAASMAKVYVSSIKDDEIKAFLGRGCSFWPDDLQPVCKVILGYAQDGVIGGIRSFFALETRDICGRIGLC